MKKDRFLQKKLRTKYKKQVVIPKPFSVGQALRFAFLSMYRYLCIYIIGLIYNQVYGLRYVRLSSIVEFIMYMIFGLARLNFVVKNNDILYKMHLKYFSKINFLYGMY